MRGFSEALTMVVAVFVFVLFIIIGLAMIRGQEPDRPDVPVVNANTTVCSDDSGCSASADGFRCVTVSTAKGTQKSCGCYDGRTDCMSGKECNERNRCA